MKDAPTLPQLADAFWAAHDVVKGRILQALATLQHEGYRGHADVTWFYPSRLALGEQVRATVVAVEPGSPLPFGVVRYEIGDEKKIRSVARSDRS